MQMNIELIIVIAGYLFIGAATVVMYTLTVAFENKQTIHQINVTWEDVVVLWTLWPIYYFLVAIGLGSSYMINHIRKFRHNK